MTTALIAIALGGLVRYARHDHFAGPAASHHPLDELGLVEERSHLVPRT